MIMNFWKETGNNANDAMNETMSLFIVILLGFIIGCLLLPLVCKFINCLI